jgi:membrane protease YdiL (CAAX protease family)
MNPLHELIRRLPPGVEFLIVVMWAFGLPIFSSILAIGAGGDEIRSHQINNANLVSLLITLTLQSLFLIWFLRIRGWTPEKMGLTVTLRGTVFGIVLAIVTYAVLRGVFFLADLVMPLDMKVSMDQSELFAKNVNMTLVYVVILVSSVFEEVFVAGYIITALSQTRGPWTGINVSTGVRMLGSLYQGPVGVLTAVPLGILFGYAYVRTRMLWPLIVANIAMTAILMFSSHAP